MRLTVEQARAIFRDLAEHATFSCSGGVAPVTGEMQPHMGAVYRLKDSTGFLWLRWNWTLIADRRSSIAEGGRCTTWREAVDHAVESVAAMVEGINAHDLASQIARGIDCFNHTHPELTVREAMVALGEIDRTLHHVADPDRPYGGGTLQ